MWRIAYETEKSHGSVASFGALPLFGLLRNKYGLSIACVGYVKGEAGSVQNEKNGEERYILPAEFVRSFAVYTASEKGALSLETGAGAQ